MNAIHRTLCVTALALGFAAAPVHAEFCALDPKPAATLLVPHFQVDLEQAAGLTTTFWVRNVADRPKLVHVHLWTDWGIPVFGFNVYLPAFGTERISLGSVLRDGVLPRTGPSLSAIGDFDAVGTHENYPGCNVAGASTDNPPLSPLSLERLRARLSGQPPSDAPGTCFGQFYGDDQARGYLTIDVVNECGLVAPSDPGYFISGGNGIASNENVLVGGVEYIDQLNNFAQGGAAIGLEADDPGAPLVFPGDTTFYGRYLFFTASDGREPLPSSWAVDFDAVSRDGGADLMVFRAVPQTNPVACGTAPSWFPLGDDARTPFDVDGDTPTVPVFPTLPSPIAVASQLFPVSMINDSLDAPSPLRGSAQLDLGTFFSFQGYQGGQSWVGVLHDSQGRFSELAPGRALDSMCTQGLTVPASVNGAPPVNPVAPDSVFLDGFSS